MSDTLRAQVVYATNHGQTEKIAARVGERLAAAGFHCDLVPVKEATDLEDGRLDLIVLAGSIHAGHHQRPLLNWAKRNASELARRPSAFLSVSLTAADGDDESRAETSRMIDEFIDESGWTPDWSLPVAGALRYREYDFFTRKLVKLISGQGGHPTDTSKDYEFTDWNALDEFISDVAEGTRSRATGATRAD